MESVYNYQRMPVLIILLWVCFVARSLSVPDGPTTVPNSVANTESAPRINATVLDHSGHDITSSFQVMLYHPNAVSVTNSSLSNRQAGLSRPLNTCPEGTFHKSICAPEHNRATSLQSYSITCQVIVPVTRISPGDMNVGLLAGFIPNQTIISRIRNGHCAEDEICVPGLGARKSRSGRQMASCVSKQFFVKYISRGHNDQQEMNLEGMRASMILSQWDTSTAMEADALKLNVETNAGTDTQKRLCRDCLELTSDPIGADTAALTVEATLLTTGAMAGVLWLAIASG